MSVTVRRDRGLLSLVAPLRLRRRRNETHRTLGQRRDGETGIDAEVGADHRAIADVHVLVAEDAVAVIDNTVLEASRR